MTPQEKQARFNFYIWKTSGGDSFDCKLFELICKADAWNRALIQKGFPYHLKVWQEWHRSDDEAEFLEQLKKEVL